MGVKWTEEQQQVIDTRGSNLLVSAAAGSGKTAVLVARILAMLLDPEHPVDIDRMLVVTFTNAAAAEMRQRIRDALEARAEEEPENEHLQRQLVLIHNAKITTIHSFCLQVLRNHFHTVGIDPAFHVADEGEMLLLKQDVLKETLDEAYEQYAAWKARQEEAAGEQEDVSEENAVPAAGKEFGEFLEQFSPGRDDRAVGEAVLALYHYSLGQPWPDEWLDDCCRMYEQGDDDWMSFAAEDAERMLGDILAQINAAIRITEEPDGPYPYRKALETDLAAVGELCGQKDYRSLAHAFENMGPSARLSTKKDPAVSEEKKQRVKELRDRAKKDLASVRDQYFYDSPEVLFQEFQKSGVIVRELVRLVRIFSRKLAAKKAEKNVLDFSDLEHLALNALLEEKDGQRVPGAAAREYAEQFEEIMIDEYQDSNLVQEILLQAVAGKGRGEPNRFMVGDVKQSIYRFRLARPELFMQKYEKYAAVGAKDAAEADGLRIDLHRNFRSRAQVLASVNYIFRQIMTKNPGGIEYDRDAALYPGAHFPEFTANQPESTSQEHTASQTAQTCCAAGSEQEAAAAAGRPWVTELLLVQDNGDDKRKEEARAIGRRIRQMVGSLPVWDGKQKNADGTEGGYRPAKYRDIVILLRTVSGWAEDFQETLTDMGIPCFTGSQRGYFSAAEIRVILAYLEVLDNPIQDIPLAAAMRSPIGGFSDDELARVRAGFGSGHFYDCCMAYRNGGEEAALREKLEQFFAQLERFRRKAAYTPVHLLIWEILDETGYGEYAASLPAGGQRKANLDMLVEKAIAYEATSYRGLYHFVRYIENLKRYDVDYGEANTGAESDDTVRIMSIHKSKGLEFPVVFVGGMAKKFNESDVRSRVVMHPLLGIGCDCVDTGLRLRRASLLKRIIQRVTAQENLGEELRVLYVAMTRAKEKLVLTGCVEELRDALDRWGSAVTDGSTRLSYSRLNAASSYLDWVMPAVLRHPDAHTAVEQAGAAYRPCGGDVWGLRESANQMSAEAFAAHFDFHFVYEEGEDEGKGAPDAQFEARLGRLLGEAGQEEPDREAMEYLLGVFGQTYPYEREQALPGKLSVSELKKMSGQMEEPDAEELYAPETVVPLLPRFGGGAGEIRGAARGTLYHLFMENLVFSKKQELERQLEELVNCGKMTRDEAEAVRLADIRKFLRSDIGGRMERAALAGELYREQPFVIGLPAREVRAEWDSDEEILIQGIIDAWFTEPDGSLVVVDYKTDRVPDMDTLKSKYRLQLAYYARALRQLTGAEGAIQLVIYSFCLGEEARWEYPG